MYTLCYILGMIAISVFIYAAVLMNRKNKQEALIAGGSTLAVIVILGIIKWLIL